MPLILHKFINDLAAIEEHQTFCGQPIDARSRVLVIGTFNPADDGVDGANVASWFYGRTGRGKFWRYFPTALTGRSLHPKDDIEGPPEIWKEYCVKNGVVIIDLIKSIEIRDLFPGFGDREIEQRMEADLANVNYFDVSAAFQGISFERVVYSLLFTDRIPKIKQIRDIINTSLLAGGCINHEGQIRYCKTPSRSNAGPPWLCALQ